MVSSNLLEALAQRVLEVGEDADEEEIQAAFREKSSSWHPDVSDDDDATDKFIAAQAARDVLLGDIDFGDPDEARTAQSNLSEIFSDDEIDDLDKETSEQVSYRSEAETRTDPSGYTREDFVGADTGEKRQMIKDIALGVETVIIHQAVEGMYERGYTEEDFFDDINEYVGEASKDQIDYGDYYEATKDSLRSEVTEALFINSCEKIEENLQQEYGQGTNIREVARIVAHFMVQGGINIGQVGRFVGGGGVSDDPRYTRSHPLGGHGRGRRQDRRYTRGGDKYERR